MIEKYTAWIECAGYAMEVQVSILRIMVCIVNSYRVNNLVLISLETCHYEAQVGTVQAS